MNSFGLQKKKSVKTHGNSVWEAIFTLSTAKKTTFPCPQQKVCSVWRNGLIIIHQTGYIFSKILFLKIKFELRNSETLGLQIKLKLNTDDLLGTRIIQWYSHKSTSENGSWYLRTTQRSWPICTKQSSSYSLFPPLLLLE